MIYNSTDEILQQLSYSKANFETVIDGKKTMLFTLKNSNGMVVTLTNCGARIVSIFVPDNNGKFADVVLGFNSISDYQQNEPTHGAVVGPYANRIAGARFRIGDKEYLLPQNDGENCLHSGPESWYRKVWDFKIEPDAVRFTIRSCDGEYGFSGNITASVTYKLTDQNELILEYQASTDKTTHINLTNHAYFNLKGEGNGDILNHQLQINADRYTPIIDSRMIPTGEIAELAGTPLDFRKPYRIGERINQDHPQLQWARGYDFNYVLNKGGNELGLAALLYEPESGRIMELYTTEPALQLYTGNFLDSKERGKSGNFYQPYSGLCLETQHFPNSPNQPNFPSTILSHEQQFRSITLFKFNRLIVY